VSGIPPTPLRRFLQKLIVVVVMPAVTCTKEKGNDAEVGAGRRLRFVSARKGDGVAVERGEDTNSRFRKTDVPVEATVVQCCLLFRISSGQSRI
jgi:hypothetical protein